MARSSIPSLGVLSSPTFCVCVWESPKKLGVLNITSCVCCGVLTRIIPCDLEYVLECLCMLMALECVAVAVRQFERVPEQDCIRELTSDENK